MELRIEEEDEKEGKPKENESQKKSLATLYAIHEGR